MLTPADNERITRIGPATPMGEVFRRYWMPALLSEELPEPDGAPVRVQLLGEDLIAFRDTAGKVGLVSAFCPHRRAPMFFGRNEECGLRCVYHGWKFDVTGACVDMPSEPPDSLFKTKVSIEAYPTWEGGEIVWTYMGPRETMPPPPDYEWIRVPAPQRHISKTYEACNYLQALEGGLDSTHFLILHNEEIGDGTFLHDYERIVAQIDVEPNAYGYQYAGLRSVGDQQWVRAYQYIMPTQQMRAARVPATLRVGAPRVDGHLWVPIDDTHTWVYNFFYAFERDGTFSAEERAQRETEAGRGPDDLLPGYRPKRNLENDYLIDRHMQKTKTFTGITGVNTQDFALQESMGPICDRSKEHLGTSDRAVIAMRQLMLEATHEVAAGRPPRGSNPADYRHVRALDHLIPKGVDWHDYLKDELLAKF